MRFDNGSVRATLVIVAMAVSAGCRSGGTGEADSGRPAGESGARTDTTPPTAPGAVSDTTAARTDSVVLRTDKSQYRAGEAMTLTLENRSGSSYAFNPCTRGIERQEGGSWSPVPEPGRMCTMEAWILDPRGTRSGPTELPTPLSPGRYRVLVRMTREQPGGGQASAVVAVSEPITVS